MSEYFPPVVGSTVWNLAGGVSQRPDYLKSLVIGGIKLQAPSIGQVLNKGYQNGPMVKLRSFLQWAHRDEDFLAQFGITSGTLLNKGQMNYETVRTEITDQVKPDQGVQVFSARIDQADVSYWVVRYLAETRDGVIPAYSYEYNPNTLEVTIKFDDGDPSEIITLTDFDNTAKYLYVGYYPIDLNVAVGTPVVQAPVTVPAGQNFPVLNGWTEDSLVDTVKSEELTVTETVDITYSDNRTPVHTGPTVIATTNDSVTERLGTYHQDGEEAPLPDNPNSSAFLRTVETQQLTYAVVQETTTTVTTQTLPGGVVETTTTTRVREKFVPTRVYQISTQTIIKWAWLTQRFYLYAQNSGKPNLDTLFINIVASTVDKYYPPIPFRYENSAIVTKSSTWHIVINVECDWADPDFELWIAKDKFSGASAIRAKYVAPGAIGLPYAYYVRAWDPGENLKSALGGDQSSPHYAPVFQWRVRLEPDDSDDDRAEHFWKSPWIPISLVPMPPQSTAPTFGGENAADLSYLHTACKKAFKKAVGAKYDDVQDDILSNESIKDIDHAFAVFGVALNVEDNRNRKYIYKFFKHVMDTTALPFEEEAWLGERERVKEEQANPTEDHLIPVLPDPPYKTLEIQSNHPGVINFKTEIKWSFIKEVTGAGLLDRPLQKSEPTSWKITLREPWNVFSLDETMFMAKASDLKTEIQVHCGEVVSENAETKTYIYKVYPENPLEKPQLQEIMKTGTPMYRIPEGADSWYYLKTKPEIATYGWIPGTVKAKVGELWWNWEVPADNYFNLGDRVELYWQVSETAWKKLVMTELEFRNYVYKNSVIKRRANVELSKPGKETDFIIPLQDDVLRTLSLADQTQIATACIFLVFNCYEIKKKEWYEEEWFNYVVTAVTIVIAVAITAITYGAAGPGAALGAASIIGGLFGLAGWAAVIVGGIILAVLSAAVGKLLSMLLGAMLKDVGPAGAVISAAISAIASIALNASSAQAWTSLSSAQTVMSLASILSTAAQTAIQESIKQTSKTMEEMWKKTGERSAELAKLMDELMGANKIDIELARQFVNELTEKPDVFLKRTLMTGSDIVESTLKMVSNYTEFNLNLDLQ